MDKNNLNVMIFIPLPPIFAWRGEGIAQTVENLIRYSQNIQYILVIGSHAVGEIQEELQDKIKDNKLVLIPIGLFKKKIEANTNKLVKFCGISAYYLSLLFFIIKKFILSYLGNNNNYITFVPFPYLSIFASIFSKKIVVSFWDPFVFEYQSFNPLFKAFIMEIFKYSMNSAYVITTQSNINKNYLVNFFDITNEKIYVIENGYPDYACYLQNTEITIENIHSLWNKKTYSYYTNIMFFIYENILQRKKVNQSLKDSLTKSVLHKLIVKTSEKDNKIIMISTQYRPYKGFECLFEVFNLLIEEYPQYYFKFVFTGFVPNSFYIKYPWAFNLVFEMQRLKNYQHAYMYKISDLVIHSSFVEGGVGNYPMFEAASINIPSLSNMGRHMLELQEKWKKNIDILVIDLIDKKSAVTKIFEMLFDNKLREKNVSLINSMRFSWQESSKKYQNLFESLVV